VTEVKLAVKKGFTWQTFSLNIARQASEKVHPNDHVTVPGRPVRRHPYVDVLKRGKVRPAVFATFRCIRSSFVLFNVSWSVFSTGWEI
jgi:hypothetical protein